MLYKETFLWNKLQEFLKDDNLGCNLSRNSLFVSGMFNMRETKTKLLIY